MAPAVRSAAEETAFMNDLLADLDDSFFNAALTPDPSPRKPLSNKAQALNHITPVKSRAKVEKRAPLRPHVVPTQVFAANGVDLVALMDGMENCGWGDMDADFLSPKKNKVVEPTKPTSVVLPVPTYSGVTCTRCVVQEISEVHVDGRFRKDLVVRLDPNNERRSVSLCDDWTVTDIRIGDVLNILGDFVNVSQPSSLITSAINITSKSNFLIHHPDLLLTATALSNTLKCRRKPLLANLVRSSSDITPALVWGNMLHEVMQACLTSGRWEETWINERIDDVIANGLAELVKIEVGTEDAKHELRLRAKGLRTFSEKYIGNIPKREAVLTNTRSERNQSSFLAIPKLHDFEEDIWSPTYGIKGKLDATVEAVISDPGLPPFFLKPVITTGPKPFEIKTGRNVAGMEHRAQTMLYTLLTAERYGVEVPSGLLYYTQADEVVRVPTSRNELRGLIGARNEMAEYMMRRSRESELHRYRDDDIENLVDDEEPFLPPTIDDLRVCKMCNNLDLCMLYRKAVENITDDTSPIAETYELKTSHLSPTQASFFKQWEALITLEEQDLVRFKKELWTMRAQEREEKGRCFSSMILDTSFKASTPSRGSGDSKIHQYTYKFIRDSREEQIPSLLSGHMTEGDAITISVEPHLLALAKGFIVQLTTEQVVVGLDHVLNLDNIHTRLAASSGSSPLQKVTGTPQAVFRIDKDELFGGMGRIRDNLAQLFYAEGDFTRLELVVDLKPPLFYSPDFDQCDAGLNKCQRQAVAKVLAAQHYALILGMPGTGKTTVIASLIRTLVGMNKTVLLTSYTHSAVDTILLKLKDTADFEILRLGNVDKVHRGVREFTLGAREKAKTMQQLEHQIMTPPVVATTCLSIDHALFARRKFDYCIVDEASQITLPVCLGPLRFADKFVLVGDHFQLPPLVRSKAARKGGLDISLFRRLSDAHPHAFIDLTYQYRMNDDIMLLSNSLIYGDRLRCGSEAVAKRTLAIPNRQALRDFRGHQTTASQENEQWMEHLLSEGCKAVFVDTDLVPAQDSRVGDLVQNEVEANLVCQITEALLHCGVRQDQIGIISLYRQQIKLLSHLLQHRKEMEILTADRSQGRDKDCIIISMVRSNDTGRLGELVKDWRRINVSFTRARSKLIVVGSRKTLQSAPILAEFFDLMDKQGWIYPLPPDADKTYTLAFGCPVVVPKKRSAQDVDESSTSCEKENSDLGSGRWVKKAKQVTVSPAVGGLLKGRPILRDLMLNGDTAI